MKTDLDNSKKDFRVWWSTGKTQRYFYVDNVDEAKLVYATLSRREQDDESIDYNAGGLEYRGLMGDWSEWYNDYGEDIGEVIDNE